MFLTLRRIILLQKLKLIFDYVLIKSYLDCLSLDSYGAIAAWFYLNHCCKRLSEILLVIRLFFKHNIIYILYSDIVIYSLKEWIF